MMLYGLRTARNLVLVGAALYLCFISMSYVLTNKLFVPAIDRIFFLRTADFEAI